MGIHQGGGERRCVVHAGQRAPVGQAQQCCKTAAAPHSCSTSTSRVLTIMARPSSRSPPRRTACTQVFESRLPLKDVSLSNKLGRVITLSTLPVQ